MRGRHATRLAAHAATALIAVACGSGAPSGEPSPTPGVDPTASAAATAGGPAATSAIPGCPNFVEVVETGPMPGGDDQNELGPVAREQARLGGDLTLVQDYVSQHADEFSSLRWVNGPWVRIVVAFTGNIAAHCEALRERLVFKDEFQITRQATTEDELHRIQREIGDFARGVFVSSGSGGDGVIDLELRADGEEVARQIAEKYGDLVAITVGLLSYPDKQLVNDARCSLPLDELTDASPLRAALRLEPGPVVSGADFRGAITITNVGLSKLAFQTGWAMTASVFRPGQAEVIGVYVGGMDAMGAGAELEPLQSFEIVALGGTASCDPALGYGVPPGDYEVRVVVMGSIEHDNGQAEQVALLSGPVPLTVIP